MERIDTDVSPQTQRGIQYQVHNRDTGSAPHQGWSLPYDPALPNFSILSEEDPEVQKATNEPAFLYDLDSFSTQDLDLVFAECEKSYPFSSSLGDDPSSQACPNHDEAWSFGVESFSVSPRSEGNAGLQEATVEPAFFDAQYLDVDFGECGLSQLGFSSPLDDPSNHGISHRDQDWNLGKGKSRYLGDLGGLSLPGTQAQLGNSTNVNSSLHRSLSLDGNDDAASSGHLPTIDDRSLANPTPSSMASSSASSAKSPMNICTPDKTWPSSFITAEAAPVPISPAADIQRCAVCSQLFASAARLL